MRTTLNLDEALIKELMAVTKAKSKTEAIHQALSEYVRREKLKRLKALSGKIHFDLTWQEMEEQELKAQEEHERLRYGHR
jgi:hypothetical protein